jgi:hypothetical protein
LQSASDLLLNALLFSQLDSGILKALSGLLEGGGLHKRAV